MAHILCHYCQMNNYSKSLSKIITFARNSSNDLVVEKKPHNLYQPIHHILNKKGKQIRSIFSLLSYDMFGGDINNLKALILAIESLHNFTLIHDDVMDNAMLRRGEETINKKWSNNQAILSGDVLLMKAYQHLLASSTNNQDILNEFTNTAILICEGQQLDLDLQQKKQLTIEQYFHMIELKTSVFIEFCLVAPCLLLGIDANNVLTMRKIGKLLGNLFQIQDDYLDLYGDGQNVGKLIGGDIIEMKKTFLYVTALQNASTQKRAELIKTYHENHNNKISKVTKLYNALDLKKSVENQIYDLNKDLEHLINEINLLDSQKKSFIEFIKILLKRNF